MATRVNAGVRRGVRRVGEILPQASMPAYIIGGVLVRRMTVGPATVRVRLARAVPARRGIAAVRNDARIG
jgi:hypothetical protein